MSVADGGSQPAAEEAERAIATIFVAARAGQLLLSAFMVATQRRRVKHPKLHVALLVGAVLESALLTYRLSEAGGYNDRTTMWSDALATAVGLVACESTLTADDGAPWMKNLVIGAAVGTSGAERRSDRIAGMAVLGASELWSGMRARGRDTHVAGLAMAASDVSNLIGMHLTARIYVSMRRRFAALMDQATTLRIEQATATSTENERARQQQLLHRATVEVLAAIGSSPDRESAIRLAQQEAGRLRHILRTKGQIPSQLDRALFDVCEEVRQRGLSVELVTAELAHEVEPNVVIAARDALHRATLSVLELGKTHKAVVRASSDDSAVRITIRDHGIGYTPGRASNYEQHLNHLKDILSPVGATVEFWSAEQRGVRVTLRLPVRTISSGERASDQAAQGFPNDGGGERPEGDHHSSVAKGYVHGRVHRDLVRTTKYQIGRFGNIDNFDISGIGQSLQSGLEQRPIGHDVSRRPGAHALTMAGAAKDFVVRTTPFDHAGSAVTSEEELQAERTIQATFLVNRSFGLVTGLATVIGGRQRFRSTGVAIGQLGVAIFESVWLGRRMVSRREWPSPMASAIDVGTVCATLVIGRMNAAPQDRSTWINWAPWSLATNAIAGLAMTRSGTVRGRVEAASVVGIFASAALSADVFEFVANGAGLSGFFVGGSVMAQQARQRLMKLREANDAAIQESIRLAAARERARQLRDLHDGALQTLETVGSGRIANFASVKSYAILEAEQILNKLNGDSPEAGSLLECLISIVKDQAREGLNVELEVDELVEPPTTVTTAFRDATIEALTNVRKHANADSALLRVQNQSGAIAITVQDFGSGFSARTPAGFGIVESIAQRMTDIGGSSEVRSRPGEGTRVVLWGPL